MVYVMTAMNKTRLSCASYEGALPLHTLRQYRHLAEIMHRQDLLQERGYHRRLARRRRRTEKLQSRLRRQRTLIVAILILGTVTVIRQSRYIQLL